MTAGERACPLFTLDAREIKTILGRSIPAFNSVAPVSYNELSEPYC